MPDYLLALLYRPLWQQWTLFLAVTLSAVIMTMIMLLASPWLDLTSTQQRFQQQANRLAQLRKKVTVLPPLQRRQAVSPADENRQAKTFSLGALWSVKDSVQVVRWQTKTSPAELDLQLQWDDLAVVFEHLAALSQPCLPDAFTVNRGQGGLALSLRLCGSD